MQNPERTNQPTTDKGKSPARPASQKGLSLQASMDLHRSATQTTDTSPSISRTLNETTLELDLAAALHTPQSEQTIEPVKEVTRKDPTPSIFTVAFLKYMSTRTKGADTSPPDPAVSKQEFSQPPSLQEATSSIPIPGQSKKRSDQPILPKSDTSESSRQGSQATPRRPEGSPLSLLRSQGRSLPSPKLEVGSPIYISATKSKFQGFWLDMKEKITGDIRKDFDEICTNESSSIYTSVNKFSEARKALSHQIEQETMQLKGQRKAEVEKASEDMKSLFEKYQPIRDRLHEKEAQLSKLSAEPDTQDSQTDNHRQDRDQLDREIKECREQINQEVLQPWEEMRDRVFMSEYSKRDNLISNKTLKREELFDKLEEQLTARQDLHINPKDLGSYTANDYLETKLTELRRLKGEEQITKLAEIGKLYKEGFGDEITKTEDEITKTEDEIHLLQEEHNKYEQEYGQINKKWDQEIDDKVKEKFNQDQQEVDRLFQGIKYQANDLRNKIKTAVSRDQHDQPDPKYFSEIENYLSKMQDKIREMAGKTSPAFSPESIGIRNMPKEEKNRYNVLNHLAFVAALEGLEAEYNQSLSQGEQVNQEEQKKKQKEWENKKEHLMNTIRDHATTLQP